MTVTVWGPIADDIGMTWWVDTITHTGPGGRLIVEERSRFASLPMSEFRTRQPADVPLDLDHRQDVGAVVHLERSERELFAVAVATDLQAEDLDAFGRLKFSTETAHDRSSGDVELRSVAIVKAADAASVGLQPIRWIPGDVRRGALDLLGIGQIPKILRRAEERCRHRHFGDPLEIEDPNWESRVVTTTEGIKLLDDRRLPVQPGDAVRRLVPDGRGNQVWAEIETRPGRILSVH